MDFISSAICFFVILFLIWYFLMTDRDCLLAAAENLGRPVSYYKGKVVWIIGASKGLGEAMAYELASVSAKLILTSRNPELLECVKMKCLAFYKGKVVWITGASTGLGEAMAYELASVGAKLILTSRNRELLECVKMKCLELSNGCLSEQDVLVLPFDMCDFESHCVNVDNALKIFGKIDVLVNNAGRYQIGSIIETQIEVMKDLFDVNFFGAVNLTRNVLKHFQEKQEGHVVIVSSIAGKFGVPSVASYVSTKHALQGFCEALRTEYHKDNIGVTIVNPGVFKSEIFSRTMGSNRGELFRKETNGFGCSEMTSARCAHLTLIAAANKLFECWIAYQPVLFMVWTSQYLPDLHKYIAITHIYTKRRIASFLDGIWPEDIPVWKPLFR